MNYLVIYASQTGNTKSLATEIFAAIPDTSKDLQSISEWKGEKDADTYFIGFWVNRGTCTMDVIELLSSLHGKNIALFGTCGMGSDPEYYRTLTQKVEVWIPEDNHYLGSFLCQGKMPIQVRRRYESMLESDEKGQVRQMIHNFDEALLHPGKEDFSRSHEFVETALKQIRPTEQK